MTKTQSIAPLDKIDCRMASWPSRQMAAKRATLAASARTATEPGSTSASATKSLYGPLNTENAVVLMDESNRPVAEARVQPLDFRLYVQYGAYLMDPRRC